MMTIDTLTTFLGWCSVINIGVLALTTIALIIMRGPVTRIHSRLFGLNQADLPAYYFQYLGNYKIAIFILNIVPYIALKIMS
jgi:hypothetical protein